MKRIPGLYLILLSLLPLPASAKVKPGQLLEALDQSARVVRGTVVKLHTIPYLESGAGYTVAELKVEETFTGAATHTLYFLASPTWPCDATHAEAGESGMYLLDIQSRLGITAHFMEAWRGKFGRASLYYLAHHGGGRLVHKEVGGQSVYEHAGYLALPPGMSGAVVQGTTSIRAAPLLKLVQEQTRIMDPVRAAEVPVVLRVRSAGAGGGSKWLWIEVEVLQVLKNTSTHRFAGTIKVAHYSSAPAGVPKGVSTLYLERYNPDREDLWKLRRGSGRDGVSHNVKAPP